MQSHPSDEPQPPDEAYEIQQPHHFSSVASPSGSHPHPHQIQPTSPAARSFSRQSRASPPPRTGSAASSTSHSSHFTYNGDGTVFPMSALSTPMTIPDTYDSPSSSSSFSESATKMLSQGGAYSPSVGHAHGHSAGTWVVSGPAQSPSHHHHNLVQPHAYIPTQHHAPFPSPLQLQHELNIQRARAAYHHNLHFPFYRLPPELMLRTCSFVDPLDEDCLDRLHFALACRKWHAPALEKLHEEVYLKTVASVEMLCASFQQPKRQWLLQHVRKLAFVNEDLDYTDTIHHGAAAWLSRYLTRCEEVRWSIVSTEVSPELSFWGALCSNPYCAATSLDLSSEQGFTTEDLMTIFRAPGLERLRVEFLETPFVELDHVRNADDFKPPKALREFTLFKPAIDGEALQCLLEMTAGSVTKFGIEMGDANGDEEFLQEDDARQAFLAAGSHLKELHLMWARVRQPWLNEAVAGLTSCTSISAGGLVCTTEIDRHCPKSLRHMDILVQVGFPGSVFADLWRPGYRQSNVTSFRIVTRTQYPEDRLEETWTPAIIEDWRNTMTSMDRIGVKMTCDFC